MSTESQRAGWGAMIAAFVGIAAVIGILVSASQNPPSHGTPTLTATRGVPGEEPSFARGGEMEPRSEPAATVRSPTDAETRGALDGSVRLASAPPVAVPASPVAAEGPPPDEIAIPAPPVALSLERRYEATAFVTDLLTVRIDLLEEEIEAARTAGATIRVRQLEANRAVLIEEAARLNRITRDLERDLGRTGIAPPEEVAQTGDDEPTEGDPEEGLALEE